MLFKFSDEKLNRVYFSQLLLAAFVLLVRDQTLIFIQHLYRIKQATDTTGINPVNFQFLSKMPRMP